MRILGIDPGLRRTGFGIIANDDLKPVVVDYGTISPPTSADLGERLLVVYDDITKIIADYGPDEIAIEDSFYGVNARSALLLGQAKGVALLAVAQRRLRAWEYAPRKVKLATTGNGRATKTQVQYMVQRILGMDHLPKPLDASDALAVAICHEQNLRLALGGGPPYRLRRGPTGSPARQRSFGRGPG